jgi:hypothetical protein
MKFSKLLVLSALALMGTNAMAEVPDGIWTIPAPTGLEFTDVEFDEGDTHYYLYNPAAKMFFASGNEWSTRASIASFGYEVWFETSSEVDAPEGSYEFWDDCQHPDRVLGYKNMFTDDGGSTWVDHADQGNYSWSVTKVGDAYRIQNVALVADKEEFDGKYIGWKGDYTDSRLYMITPEEGAVDWKFVTMDSYLAFKESADYEAYSAAVAAYGDAMNLKTALIEAESLGANIDAQLAIYKNTASTSEDLKNATTAINAIIDARKALKKQLDDAKSKGFKETEAFDAVYANGTATAEDLKKALEELNNALVEWGKSHASVENPADMSAKIVNPNFDGASASGWSGTSPNMVGSGSHGPANVAETWNNTFDMYQDIEGLPAGVYAVGAQTMWRCHWTDMQNGVIPAAKLYAVVNGNETQVPFNYAFAPMVTEAPDGSNTSWGVSGGFTTDTDEETGTTYYIPNDPSAFRIFAELGYYDTKLLVGVNDGDTLRIGVKNPSMKGTWDNWSCYDTFSLTYYGTGADAAQLYLTEALKNFSDYNPEEGVVYTESYLTDYKAAYSGDLTASSFDEVSAILGNIDTTFKALEKNMSLWKDWQDAVVKGQSFAIKEEYAGLKAIDALSDYVDESMGEYLDILEKHSLANEDLEAEIAKIEKMIKDVIDESKLDIYDGKDMTTYITNPSFDEDKDIDSGKAEGWTIDAGTGGNITRGPLGQSNKELMEGALGYMNYCFEAWHRYNWDVWQEIENLPVGMYQLDVQGYVRCEVGGYNRGDELGGEYTSPVYLYMNSAMSQFPSVYSETRPINEETGEEYEYTTVEGWTTEDINGYLYPNSMGGAAQAFGWGMYKTTAYGLISKEGDKFRIGVKMNSNQDWWCIWDNFKLTYRTPTAEIVKPILDDELGKLDLSAPMGKNVYAAADELKKQAAEAADGQAMFAILSDVYDLSESIINSTALFAKLKSSADNLENAIGMSENAAVKTQAGTLLNKINNGIENHEFADDEVEGLMNEIDLMITQLAMPGNMAEASDANPVECTGVIKSASFEDADGMNSSAGWNNAGNLGNDDTQKGALAIEFWQSAFDMSQTIKGLPKGTYKVTVDAWCRIGDNAENYTAWKADENATMAYLYAVDGDSTVYAAPVANLMKAGETLADSYGYEGETEYTVDDVTYYLPGSLVSGKGAIEMNEGVYTNSVIAKVGEDGVLTIGIKKAEEKTNSWVVADDFKLYYFGENSEQAVSGDASGIETAEMAAKVVEFFNLNGARINKPAKGVALVKRIAADGSVKVQKVVIK